MDLVDWVKYELVCIAGDGEPRLCTLPHPTNTLQDTGPGNGRRGGGRREEDGGKEGGGEEGGGRRMEKRREEGGGRRMEERREEGGGKSRKMGE